MDHHSNEAFGVPRKESGSSSAGGERCVYLIIPIAWKRGKSPITTCRKVSQRRQTVLQESVHEIWAHNDSTVWHSGAQRADHVRGCVCPGALRKVPPHMVSKKHWETERRTDRLPWSRQTAAQQENGEKHSLGHRD